MLFGYARVSTRDQNLDLQMDALRNIGCDKIFTDQGVSGAKTARPGLDAILERLRDGDGLAVWRLDRLGRSMSHLIKTVADLEEAGIAFKSLEEAIDTSTASGKLIFHIFASLAEFERALLKERSMAGMQAARARGKVGGRPGKLNPTQIKRLLAMFADREITIGEITRTFNIGKTTVYRYAERDQKARARKAADVSQKHSDRGDLQSAIAVRGA